MVSNNRPLVKATMTSFTILEAVRDRQSAGVTEIARDVGLSKSAVYKHLTTLTELGYLVKEDTKYHLSLSFQGLSACARDRHPIHSAEPAIDNLARTTGKLASFMIYENGYGIYAYQTHVDADEPPLPAFSHVPLHATAGGKTILAYLPAEKRKIVLDEIGLSAMTEKTITDRDTLQRELRSVRDRRVAFDREEFTTGYQCVGSPIVDANSHAIGAVSVSGSIREMSGKRLEEDITGLVVSTAKSIENEIRSI